MSHQYGMNPYDLASYCELQKRSNAKIYAMLKKVPYCEALMMKDVIEQSFSPNYDR